MIERPDQVALHHKPIGAAAHVFRIRHVAFWILMQRYASPACPVVSLDKKDFVAEQRLQIFGAPRRLASKCVQPRVGDSHGFTPACSSSLVFLTVVFLNSSPSVLVVAFACVPFDSTLTPTVPWLACGCARASLAASNRRVGNAVEPRICRARNRLITSLSPVGAMPYVRLRWLIVSGGSCADTFA